MLYNDKNEHKKDKNITCIYTLITVVFNFNVINYHIQLSCDINSKKIVSKRL